MNDDGMFSIPILAGTGGDMEKAQMLLRSSVTQLYTTC
jgi:hypothetical protein